MKKIALLSALFLLLAGCGPSYVPPTKPTNDMFSYIEVGKAMEILVDYETGCQYFVYGYGSTGKAIYPRLTKDGLMYCTNIKK